MGLAASGGDEAASSDDRWKRAIGLGADAPKNGSSSILAIVEALAPCAGCILSVYEGDRSRSEILDLLRLTADAAWVVLAFDPRSDPGAVVYDAPDCRVVVTRLHARPGRACGLEAAEGLAGGSVFQMVLDRKGERTWLLSLVRDGSQEPFSAQDMIVLSSLGPVLRGVLRREQDFHQLAAMLSMVGGSVDEIAFGILLVDAERRVLWSNATSRTILSSCKAIGIVGQRLKATEPRQELRLREIVHELAEGPPGVGRALALTRGDAPQLQLGFVRLPAGSQDAFGPVTAVFLSRTGAVDLSASFLRELYGLTPVEAEIARLICQGLAPAAAADHLRLSVHTVRDYLKPIFQKMGVHRQADMVRVAASFAGLLRWTSGAARPGPELPSGRPRREN